MSAAADAATTQKLAQRYGEAWNAHDIDAIVSMHAAGMTFRLHLPGYADVTGEAALREHFAMFFRLWPNLEFRSERLTACERLIANEMTMVGTLAEPMPVGAGLIEPNGKRIAFDAVDVIPVKAGRVLRKDTYVDAAALLQQLAGLS